MFENVIVFQIHLQLFRGNAMYLLSNITLKHVCIRVFYTDDTAINKHAFTFTVTLGETKGYLFKHYILALRAAYKNKTDFSLLSNVVQK